ncbi:MAG: dCTP deaminase domain-containing protein [Culicoidibacterales bacterium]
MKQLRGFEKVTTYATTAIIPQRQTQQAAGYDFHVVETMMLQPAQVTLIPTGIKAFMPRNEFLGLYIRSSVAVKKGLIMVNSVGIVDADYYNNSGNEGHIYFACYNVTSEVVVIEAGERIGQGIFQPFAICNDEESAQFERQGGFGSTNQ